jgi:inosose dehydratase
MPTLSVDDALAHHAAIGFRAIEITVLPHYATAVERFDAAERKRTCGLLRRYELACSGIACFQTLTDPDEETTAPILASQRAAIDLASDVATTSDPPVLAFFSGGTVEDWPAARSRLIERIGGLAEHARRRGVVLAMKAHANGCVSRPYQLVDLHEQIDSPSFRFCFDMSHFEVQGLSIEQAMYPLLPLAVHTEVKASVGRSPNQEYMIPGEPKTQSDFVGQFRAMKSLGYQGYLVPEMSVHVMRRPHYEPVAALRLAYVALTHALAEAGSPPG